MKHWDTGINNDSILCTHTHPVTGFALIDNPSIPQHAHISPPLHLHDGRGGGGTNTIQKQVVLYLPSHRFHPHPRAPYPVC